MLKILLSSSPRVITWRSCPKWPNHKDEQRSHTISLRRSQKRHSNGSGGSEAGYPSIFFECQQSKEFYEMDTPTWCHSQNMFHPLCQRPALQPSVEDIPSAFPRGLICPVLSWTRLKAKELSRAKIRVHSGVLSRTGLGEKDQRLRGCDATCSLTPINSSCTIR